MTSLGKIRVFIFFILIGAVSPAWLFAQQDQTPPDSAPKSQPGEPPTPRNSQDQATGPGEPKEGQPKPATGASSEQQKHRAAKKRKKTTPVRTESGKVVVTNGGAKEHPDQLAPAMTKEQEVHERANTSQLLASTDANLKSIAGRQLTPVQQNMLAQIRTYMNQSKAASDAGDLARANTFASKARLLSDELAKK